MPSMCRYLVGFWSIKMVWKERIAFQQRRQKSHQTVEIEHDRCYDKKGLIYEGWLHSLLVILESCGLTAVTVITPVCLIEMSAVCCLLCTLKKIHKRLLLNFPLRLSGLSYCTTLLQLDIYGIIVDTEAFVFRCNLKKRH